MKTAVIGLGNMGTAMAHLLSHNGHEVKGWDIFPDVLEDIRLHGQNSRFLPGVELSAAVVTEPLLSLAAEEAELLVVAVPSLYFRQTIQDLNPFLSPGAVILGVGKGLDPHSGKRLSQIYADATPRPLVNYAALSGPSIANEFARQKPCAVALACASSENLELVARALRNDYFRVETEEDLPGVEWGGVLKNIYAIGMGLLDGLNQGTANLKSAYLTLALREMKNTAVAFGAKPETLDGLAGLGDLLTTGLSPDSHNRRFGEFSGQGMETEKIREKLGGFEPEGVRALSQVLEIIKPAPPLASLIQKALFDKSARDTFLKQTVKLIK